MFLCQTLCKLVHLYLILGFFQYEADQPTVNSAYLTVSFTYNYITLGKLFYVNDEMTITGKHDYIQKLKNITGLGK